MSLRIVGLHLNDFLRPFHQCPTYRLSALPAIPERTWSIPLLPDEIWLEIFEFATYCHPAKTVAPLDAFTTARVSNNVMAANTPYLSLRTKCALVFVCRAWRRVALRLLYEFISISSLRMANLVLAALRSESPLARVQLGDYVRHLDITVSSRGGFDYLVATFQIMRLCPNMRHITGRWNCELPKEYLSAISKLYGGSLKGLNWINQVSLDTVPFFGTFSSLRTLDLRGISGQVEHFEASSPASRPCLPRVNTLLLSSSFSPFFASFFSFPSLENITIETPPPSPLFNERLSKMLAVHGHTIVAVDILPPQIHGEYDDRGCDLVDPSLFLNPTTCPNLHSLTFPQASKQPFVHSHPNIRRIGIRAIKSDYLYPNKSSSTKDHLMAINRDLYPSLEVVRTVGFLVDSCGDSLIKDIFIWWAERFEGQGIDFQDGEGVIWLYNEAEPDPLPDEQPIAPSLAPISSS